jgi:hypothetical protein
VNVVIIGSEPSDPFTIAINMNLNAFSWETHRKVQRCLEDIHGNGRLKFLDL